MKIKLLNIIGLICYLLSLTSFILFIYLRHHQLYEETLLDTYAIIFFISLSAICFIGLLLLRSKIKSNTVRRTLKILYPILILIAILNEINIYRTNSPEILLEANRANFLNGTQLFIRDDETYKVEQYELLHSLFSYGKYKRLGGDTIVLIPNTYKRSFLHGTCVYKKDLNNGEAFIDSTGYLYFIPNDDPLKDTTKPFYIKMDKFFR